MQEIFYSFVSLNKLRINILEVDINNIQIKIALYILLANGTYFISCSFFNYINLNNWFILVI